MNANPSRPSANIYVIQAAFAASMMFAEIYLFGLLNLRTDHHQATFVVSITLGGLALGSIASFILRPKTLSWPAAVVGIPLAALAAAHLLLMGSTDHPTLLTIVLMLPFFAGLSYVLSSAYYFAPPGRVVFVELLGAVVGSGMVYLALDTQGLELTGAACATLTLVSGAIGLRDRELVADRPRGALVYALLILVGLLGFASVNFISPTFLSDPVIRPSEQMTRLVTLPSFEGRVDVYAKPHEFGVDLAVYANGRLQDHISEAEEVVWQFDPRIPAALVPSPRVFIIGASAQGICRSARLLAGADVHGVELNPSIAALMTDYFHPESGGGYDGLTITVDEGRATLARSEGDWDIITLMNPHPYTSAFVPDYLHTVEAFQLFMEKLSPEGSVIIELRVDTETRLATLTNLLLGIRQALVEMGAEHPERSVLTYAWSPQEGAYYPYVNVIFRRLPYQDDELAALDDFFTTMELRTQWRMAWLSRPDDPAAAEGVLGTGVVSPDDERLAGFALSAPTDDHPFLRQVHDDPTEIRMMFLWCLVLALVLILGAAITERVKRRSNESLVQVVARYGYFSGLGAALLMMEFYLIQLCQLFVGPPGRSFLIVLTALLLGGSLGGYITHRWELRRALKLCALAVVGGLVALAAFRAELFAFAAGFEGGLRGALVFGFVTGLSVLHGMLFPGMLRHLKQHRDLGDYLPLLYGVSSAATVAASIAAIYLSVRLGITATLLLTCGVYVFVILCDLVLGRGDAEATQ